MKRIPLVLIGVLAFASIVTYISISARGLNPNRTEFSEHLVGEFVLGSPTQHGQWTDITPEVVPVGSGEGNLAESTITFTMEFNRRFKEDDGKSFIKGTWRLVLADESSISGSFIGSGTSPDEFWGELMTNESEQRTGSFVNVKIKGEFHCLLSPLPQYGNMWKYEAWWNGTIQQGEE